MKKVSLCLILAQDYVGTVYSFERSGFKVVPKEVEFIVKDAPKEFIKVVDNVEVELLVAYTDITDKRLIEYFTPLATEMVLVDLPPGIVGGVNDSKAYNALFEKAKNEYICILKPYVFLQQHWLTELIYYHQTIANSGVVSVCPNFGNVDFIPLATTQEDHLLSVFVPKDNMVNQNGVCFFLRQHLFFIGAFDESCLLDGNEINQFQLRSLAMGLQNYYIPAQSCLIINQRTYHQQALSNSNMAQTISEMKKVKNYYIPLKTTL